MKEEIIVNIPYREEDKHLNLDGSVINLGNYKITIISRPTTPTKDFLWYIDQYLYENGSTNDQIVNWLSDDIISTAKHRLKTSQFSLVPWEIKMGLFKFICSQIRVDMTCMTNNLKLSADQTYVKLFTKEFVNDLFKNKN